MNNNTKSTLIKLSESHYVVVDDSEIKEDDKFIDIETNEILTCHGLSGGKVLPKVPVSNGIAYPNKDFVKKINYSTQPLKIIKIPSEGANIQKVSWGKIKPLSLLEVKELIYGYSVEKMAESYYKTLGCLGDDYDKATSINLIKWGFNAHKELVKDKLFTVEDMRKCWGEGFKYGMEKYFKSNKHKTFKQYLKTLLPPTEIKWGFNAYEKLVKDKLFTQHDILRAIEMARLIFDGKETFECEDIAGLTETDTYGWKNKYSEEQIIQSLLPKTEWPVTFDEQGKLKLL